MIIKNYKDDHKITIDHGKIITLDTKYESIYEDIIKKYKYTLIDNDNVYFLGEDVKEELDLYSNPYDKDLLITLLELFELKESFMDRKIDSLSNTEKVYLNIIRNTLLAKAKIYFKDIFLYLDHIDKKRVINYLDYLKQNEYFIIISSSNVDDLYKLGEQSIIFYEQFFKYDKTDKIYTDVQKLLDNNITVPTLCLITYKAKKEKDVKLFYRKDVRDTIKDIYKHV